MSVPDVKLAAARGLRLRERLRAYYELVRLHRPIGIFLLMWPALWALWIAGDGQPPWAVVVIFVLGVVLMRSAGCAINDYADRDFDGHVRRTMARPLAAGIIRPGEALGVFVVLCLLAFALVLMLNWQTVALSFVAVGLAAIYPFMKRFTHLPQVFLGAAFGWAVPMAFMAINGSIPGFAWLIFIAAVVWALIYDTQYAMVDREDDLKIGIKSTAILFGQQDRLVVGLLQVLMLALLVGVGLGAGLGFAYYASLAVAAGLALYQQWLIIGREPERCFHAFLNNNYYGMVVFAGVAINYLTLKQQIHSPGWPGL
ncbi:4-hydroxybenzoate octaprenyltransferase [Thiorhodovibrio frisius]|uniref:4-hydroxybenzoate octaprenyltransferase n=1 Tax=Thiorhodovibrio frisius TaxID=631362 RepID=H8YYJ5_9GAMM|nr:4-hydroxybenzoate octaprenyltransferase [Thiorhodovibrio frisius]EIC23521.1 4-hydroxybenzoate polyprenyl transferase, proteobacterial [Thiorhodovibrio frisius]WPL23392.1 4-hydroxybenzoate octaprenyltransferase [Thiorhodovibrio frisius]